MYRARAIVTLMIIAVAVAAAIPTHSLKAGDTLIYQLDLSMKASGIGIEDVNMKISGTVKITIINMTEDYITMRVEPSLSVEGVPPEYSDIVGEMNQEQTIKVPTYGMLGPLGEEGGAGLNDMISIIQEQLQALGFNETNVEVSEVSYNGIPAIKLKIDLKASNYLGMGSNIEIHAVSYLDMATLALLYGEATAKYAASTGGFEYSYKIQLTNPDILQQSLAGYEVEVEGGRKVSMVFAAAGLSVSEPEVTSDRVRFTVTGEGIGSVIIKAEPGAPEPSVYVDGSPVSKYKITTAADGTTYYKVPIKFSQHEVEVVFGRPVLRAAAVKLSLPSEGGGAGPLIGGSLTTTILIIVAVVAIAGVAAAIAIKRAKRGGPEAAPAAAPEPPQAPPTPPPPSA